MEPRTGTAITSKSNRVKQDLESFYDQETTFQLNNPIAAAKDYKSLEIKSAYFQALIQHYEKSPSASESATLWFLKKEVDRLEAKIKPSSLGRIWHHPSVARIRHLLAGNYGIYREHKLHLMELQKQKVEGHNLTELTKAFKENGFTKAIDGPLKMHLALGADKFSIRYFDVSRPDTDYVLNCSKIPGTPIYQFESFEAMSRPLSEQRKKGDTEIISHTFKVNDGIPFNAIEAGNLVNRRSVEKFGEWFTFDATSFNESFPFTGKIFNLLKAIEELPFRIHLERPGILKGLTEKLSMGELAEVTLPTANGNQKVKLKADPNSETIHVMDSKQNPLNKADFSDEEVKKKKAKAQTVAKPYEKKGKEQTTRAEGESQATPRAVSRVHRNFG